jgi:LPS export ABC transporter protein LptC
MKKNKIHFKVLIFSILIAFISQSCDEKKVELPKIIYNGPLLVVDNLNVTYSDSGYTKIKLSSAKQLKYSDENEFYPKPVFVTFYDKNNFAYTSIRGDSARFIKNENLYKIMGNVFLLNQSRHESLSTPELFWSADRRTIYTDKPVVLKNPDEELKGVGFTANQDFTNVKMRKLTGIISVEADSVGTEE